MSSRAFYAFAVAVFVALGLAAMPCAAQVSSQRLVYRFDFEDRARGVYYEDLPMHWFRIGMKADTNDPHFMRVANHMDLVSRPGFPQYSQVRFDKETATGKGQSVHLGLNGGNVGLFLEAGTLAAVPNSDYLISASARTSGLKHAKASLIAYFVDDRGRKIPGSAAKAQVNGPADKWGNITVKLPGDFTKASWIGIELLIEQPTFNDDSLLGVHQIVPQDVRGGAWFDDIAIWQLPRVGVKTQNTTNIVHWPERPQVNLQVRDLTGHTVVATATIYDHNLKEVAKSRYNVGDGSPTNWIWTPQLTRYGWYLCEMSVRDPASKRDEPVAQSIGAFLWLPDEGPIGGGDSVRFGYVAEGVADGELSVIPSLMDRTGVDSVVISCWDEESNVHSIPARQSKLDEMIQGMLVRGRQVTMSLSPMPDELAKLLDVEKAGPPLMFGRSKDLWTNYLTPVLLRHGQRVSRWQIGSTKQAEAFFLDKLPDLMREAGAEFRSLVAQPDLVLPWRADQSRRPDLKQPMRLAMSVPSSVPPSSIRAQLQEFDTSPAVSYELRLQGLDATRYSHARRIDDLSRRMIYGWQTNAEAILLDKPWVYTGDERAGVIPDPLIGVYSQIAHRLGGRRALTRLPIADGVECWIFDGRAGGMLVAWNEFAPPGKATINMLLGDAPVVSDVWGNRQQVPLVNGTHRVELTSTPVFVEGIDPLLAMFRASFSVDPPFLESTQAMHQGNIKISNPWTKTISGHVQVLQPKEWRVDPRRSYFSIAPGQSTLIPIQISFPPSEVAGRKSLVARFEFESEKYRGVEMSTQMEIGLREVSLDATLSVEPGSDSGKLDAVVTQLITNTGSRPLSLYAFATMQGFPRQDRVVPRIMPGQVIVRRFRFPAAGESLADTPVRVGLRESGGPAVLNKLLTVQSQ